MPQKIILKYRNPEVLWVGCGYILMSSLLLFLQVERGFFILIGVFSILVMLSIRASVKNYCETTIKDEEVSVRKIVLKGHETYSVNDPKLSFTHNRGRYYITGKKITVIYNRKALSQHTFSNKSELKRFYETTSGLGFRWKNKPE